MNVNKTNYNRIFINPNDLIITDLQSDSHSLTNEEVRESLERQKAELLKQFESLFGNGGEQSVDEDDFNGSRRDE